MSSEKDRLRVDERERWIKQQTHNFLPVKVFNEDTGLKEDFLLFYCFNCSYPQPSALNRAE